MIEWSALIVFVILFALVTIIGFLAARWRSADLNLLEEWGLAGRKFGTVITWFLLGGDLYTAYTFVAVPGLVFGAGAVGMFALPYTIIAYPLFFLVTPKLWQVAHNRGHITAADFVKDRFDSRLLALLVAITGIVATMPYIALQMFGMQLVLAQMGLDVHISLIVAFVILAAFTYVSGLRAPALIALVKDTLIWAAVIIAIIYIPIKLGGYGAIFSHVPAAKLTLKPALFPYFSTLALGSAFALFLYPHAITGIFSSRSQAVLRRNSAFLPAYSFMLGLIALFGYMAIAAGVHAAKPPIGANVAVPALISKMFSEPVQGFFFAAIAIGALVPASVMSIAAANLFSRNIWKEFLRPAASLKEQADVSKVLSLLVKFGALLFILIANTQYAIYFQLAGGVWMMQTLPAVFMALYFKWLDRWAIVLGWLVGEGLGTYWLIQTQFKVVSYNYNIFGNKTTLYIGLVAFFFNLIVVIVGSGLARALGVRSGKPIITDDDYLARSAVATPRA